MSAFYDLASLVVVPSGYKTGKVYAQKPLTTDGQLTFSRASVATRVNASGLIEEVASNVPRLDYLGSTCPKLLLEPQRTNLITYSEQFNNAAWASSSGTPITANTTISPSGYQDADTYAEGGIGNYLFRAGTSSSGTFTVSLFAKKGSSTNIGIGLVAGGFTSGMSVQFNFDTQTFATPVNYGNFTSISATSQDYGNGWYRLALTGTTASATTYFYVLGSLPFSSYIANAKIWGAQLEAGAYATSYIPTLGASVTKNADAASKTGISSLIGQTEGTIYWEGSVAGSVATIKRLVSLSDGTTSNAILIQNSANGTTIQYVVLVGAVQQAVISKGSAFTFKERFKIAAAYKENDFAIYINGVQVGTSTSGSVPATSKFAFDRGNDTTAHEGDVNQALLFKTRLTNAQLAELTTL